ncbi:MAG TPA: DUF4143 domain-containing protein [Myxococcota bacterium]|nr:DUF4143 domain-containing protein [Myxococcota bacterium]HOS61957.1 DUF4143 domain-containing protein [Myxococcota bacterium]HPC91720.1 DUF4143 domain-containing protein [Myxococcota bacterium]HPL25036.1 DUF4143 domain-containing protein [Myxococcota bacterium]HQE73388.1 DUF4143 domain-containing protein [Myxococcota bacterium]
MRRFIDEQLDRWVHAQHRKPLIVRGARQVGKTWSIHALGARKFAETVTVDLERHTNWHQIFEGDLDAKRMVGELEIVTGKRFVPGKTLLFFDEIQACPRAITALRYFHEEMPELHVIAAGSLLEFALGDYSVPVGRVQYLDMLPMTFVETLWASGNDAAAQMASDPFVDLGSASHTFLMEQVRHYCFIGGMPEAVSAWQKGARIAEIFGIQAALTASFRDDFAKYSRRANPRLMDQVLVEAAASVGQQIKYSRLAPDSSGPQIKAALELLLQARILRKVKATDPSGLPLGAGAKESRFKLLFLDIGLWQQLRGVTPKEFLRQDLMAIHRGAMAEQFVGQELAASQGCDLYYWAREARSSSAEVDYLAVRDGNIYAVEVKSGPAGKLRSLHMLLASYPKVSGGLVFQDGQASTLPEQRISFLPLYHAWGATKETWDV